MPEIRRLAILGLVTLLGVLTTTGPSARAQAVKTVFVIAMENHNWTQPDNQFTGPIQQIFQINMLPSSTAW